MDTSITNGQRLVVMRALVFILAVTATACGFGESDELSPETPDNREAVSDDGRETAYSALERMAENGAVLEYVSEQVHADGRFGHLRVRFEGEGRPSRKFAVTPQGTISSLESAKAAFAKEHSERWGNIRLSTARRIARGELLDKSGFMAWYDPHHPELDALHIAVQRIDPEYEVRQSPPTIFLQAEPAQLLEHVAKHPAVNAIDSTEYEVVADAPSTSLPPASGPPGVNTAAVDTKSWESFNSCGLYAEDIHVGVYENTPEGCGVWDRHVSMTFAGVNHLNPLTECEEASDCTFCSAADDPSQAHDYACAEFRDGNRYCVADHVSQVASRIAATTCGGSNQLSSQCESVQGEPTPMHAAGANLHVANRTVSSISGQIDYNSAAVQLVDLYQELLDRGVRIVNESFSVFVSDNGNPVPGVTAHSTVTDWFARHEGVTFVKSSGNTRFDVRRQEVTCTGLNKLCVGGTLHGGSIGDPATYDDWTDDIAASGARWRNFQGKEIERPDVVSPGSHANVMQVADDWPDGWFGDMGWTPGSGTSFSTPAVTGLVALFREAKGYSLSPNYVRAVVRHTADYNNDLEGDLSAPIYPTPGDSPDAMAGTKMASGPNLCRWSGRCCLDPEPPGGGYDGKDSGDGEGIDTPGSEGWVPAPSWAEETDPPEETDTRTGDVYTGELKQATGEWKTLWALSGREKPVISGRIRVSFSYFSCPGAGPTDQVTDLAPAIDFDIAVCSDAQEKCVAASESLDDTNEGFDVRYEFEERVDDLRLVLIRPHASEDPLHCETERGYFEPYAWAATHWWSAP